jgi:hypothetical protein
MLAPGGTIVYRPAQRTMVMVAFQVSGLQMASLDDGAFALVLEAAAQAGGPSAFPILYALADSEDEIEPLAFLDDLARLAASESGRPVGHLIGNLRDDLMEALAASEEG